MSDEFANGTENALFWQSSRALLKSRTTLCSVLSIHHLMLLIFCTIVDVVSAVVIFEYICKPLAPRVATPCLHSDLITYFIISFLQVVRRNASSSLYSVMSPFGLHWYFWYEDP